MNILFIVAVVFSSVSFLLYSISYFFSPFMKEDFKRFNLEKIGIYVILLEILGAVGLLVGLEYNIILLISSFGLSLMMFFGLIYRIKYKDSLLVSLPAMFYMLLNAYIFFYGIINL
jgi:hypothetical protein